MRAKAFNDALNRCFEIATEAVAMDQPEVVWPSLDDVQTRLKIEATIPINNPFEPMLCVFANGAWEVAYESDTEWMMDVAPASNPMQIIPFTAIVNDFNTWLKARQSDPDVSDYFAARRDAA